MSHFNIARTRESQVMKPILNKGPQLYMQSDLSSGPSVCLPSSAANANCVISGISTGNFFLYSQVDKYV